ncbi:MAG: hypothetical protein KC423_29260, partial [Anaerolineales bacterium]|nr:hypothetical protein [Anaerolineales bacterium]
IQPQLGGNLTFARAELMTGYGRLASRWQLTKETFTLDATIPPNTTATIVLPSPDPAAIFAGERPLTDAPDLRSFRQIADQLFIEVGSGTYTFSVQSEVQLL